MTVDFAQRPFIAIWETTRACALRCVHCRAEAIPRRDPRELTTEEGRRLIERIAAFGSPPPILVLTGGDPFRRADLAELVAHGTAVGVPVSVTPSGTAAVTEPRLRALRDAGLARLAVSLDGASAETHDGFRGVRGSHAFTLRIVERARALGLPLQINTTVSRQTAAELPAVADLVADLGVALWALFFLIPVGRARRDQALDAREIEDVLRWAAALASRAGFPIKTTEAPHFHRVLADEQDVPAALPAGRRAAAPAGAHRLGRAGRAVTDGNGFVFVDHVGEICPSGFLPMSAGNVRRDDLVAVYRDAPLFRALRDPSRLTGRCGRCEYRDRCGGSRARAWALSGDPLGEDPGCAWQPGSRAPARIAAEPRPDAATPRLPRTDPSPAPVPRTDARALAIGGLSGAAREGAPDVPAPVHANAGNSPARAEIIDALRAVLDPELGMSVVDLGLVYVIEIRGEAVSIAMTLTSPGCPLGETMKSWVQREVLRVPGVQQVDVAITFDPPWTPARIGAAVLGGA